MIELTFPVCVEGGDADVEISVSDRDAKILQRYSQDDSYDSPEDVDELEEVSQRLRRKILKGLADQVEDYEDIGPEDLDFTFGFPEFDE